MERYLGGSIGKIWWLIGCGRWEWGRGYGRYVSLGCVVGCINI